MPLPAPLSALLRLVDFPQYVAVGCPNPQPFVDVWIADGGERRNVTDAHVIASLRPLTIAVAEAASRPAPLILTERETGRTLGTIALRPVDAVNAADIQIGLFHVSGSRNLSLPTVRFRAYSLFERWRVARQQKRQQHNFRVSHRDLLALLVYYTCPRPVVLVTAPHADGVNLFPMDLIGPLAPSLFSLALRSTSASVSAMTAHRRVAIANIPLGYKATAYQLGRHHQEPSVDVSGLPFRIHPSPTYALPVTSDAIRLRELEIIDVRGVGSHTLFLSRVVTDSGASGPPALHHVSGVSLARPRFEFQR